MGDTGDDYKMMNDLRKDRHAKMFDYNMRVLNDLQGQIDFDFKDTVCLFRERGKPKVDFYPHTGRWKVMNKVYSGGVQSFLNWYRKQGG